MGEGDYRSAYSHPSFIFLAAGTGIFMAPDTGISMAAGRGRVPCMTRSWPGAQLGALPRSAVPWSAEGLASHGMGKQVPRCLQPFSLQPLRECQRTRPMP